MRMTDFAGSANSSRRGMSAAAPFGPFRSVRLVAACAQAPWAPPAKPQMPAVEAAIACRRSKVIGAIGDFSMRLPARLRREGCCQTARLLFLQAERAPLGRSDASTL